MLAFLKHQIYLIFFFKNSSNLKKALSNETGNGKFKKGFFFHFFKSSSDNFPFLAKFPLSSKFFLNVLRQNSSINLFPGPMSEALILSCHIKK